ncbi:hypothetical protein DAPPUDRAFT_256556 [Daphnia pulex]|uniref:Uncharacterized protein n=1 Tax=Daphnia pulex TaxID=6669 RepID=E9HBM4_DAPPU|nr:hypothetical protein DAPPUDRAFT_256556 [Daphnia pulex]|eukprot:EFX70896.1 hypothetical protein DAPPUDRAFT_256556 [Daphnia pulex]
MKFRFDCLKLSEPDQKSWLVSLITSAYTYREWVVTPTDPKGKEAFHFVLNEGANVAEAMNFCVGLANFDLVKTSNRGRHRTA